MYCKNCGQILGEKARSCEHCGFTKGNGLSYCPECGRKVLNRAEVCEYCGTIVFSLYTKKSRFRFLAGILGVLLGFLGAHNFYLGYIKKGIFQLVVTVLLCVIGLGPLAGIIWAWALYESYKILRGDVRVDARGNFIRG